MVEFQQLHGRLQERFRDLNKVQAVKYIRHAFPLAESKRSTKKGHKTIYVGIHSRCVHPEQSQLYRGEQSCERQVIPSTCASGRNVEDVLQAQTQSLLSRGILIAHGPDSLANLEKFSIDGVMEEVRQFAPDLLILFERLGDVYRNEKNDDGDDNGASVSNEKIKSLIAVSVLLNARSQKCTGIQLFIGMMLVARATNRQV